MKQLAPRCSPTADGYSYPDKTYAFPNLTAAQCAVVGRCRLTPG